MNPVNNGQDQAAPGAVAFDALRPWQSYLRPELDGALASWRAGSSVASALTATRAASTDGNGVPHFVPQSALPASQAYEAFIHRSRQVPTRNNLHDYFNGLAWPGLAWPGLAWSGLVWSGLVWSGLVWSGLAGLPCPRSSAG